MSEDTIEPLGNCELDQVQPGRRWILIVVAVVFSLVEFVLVGLDSLAEAMPFSGPTFRRMPFPLDTIEGAGGWESRREFSTV